jgi:beta-N-acetylhexosaminidase
VEISELIRQKLMLAFDGFETTPAVIKKKKKYRPGGVTLFRHLNLDNPEQVRRLTSSLQDIAQQLNLPPLFIAVDQEGGQLNAIGNGTTQLPGNMALGAIGSPDLARKAGSVLGNELAAMGINIDYAPVCDVNNNPENPVIGIRSFGENPASVAELVAAMVEGIQSTGVAATGKHFPGHGNTSGDSHHSLPYLHHDLDIFQEVEFPPFQAAIDAGIKLIMSAHIAVPAIDGPAAPPATLSSNLIQGVLRDGMGFEGVSVTDAMDMNAIPQDEKVGESAKAAANAGMDLLLLTTNQDVNQRIYDSLISAYFQGELKQDILAASLERIAALKRWVISSPTTEIDVVNCSRHQLIAQEIAEGSLTLVRNNAGLLPLRLQPEQRVAVIITKPLDLTPADTSSYIIPDLVAPLRRFHSLVDEFQIAFSPSQEETAGLLHQLDKYDVIIIGTINAIHSPQQADLVNMVIQIGVPSIVVANRLPYDLAAFPQAATYICTYSILQPSMEALAKALFGEISFEGRLPVSIPGLYDSGHSEKYRLSS